MRAVDLFAGWGGFTCGAEQAGARVLWAANHWQLAVDVHAANHPSTAHTCQDLRQADWTALPRYDLLLASPACQGHSTASQPKRRGYHDAMRATAWAVVDCADVTEPRALLVENVLAFREWRLYPEWRAALERIGYRLTELVVTASHHGVPQRRTRLFVAGFRGRRWRGPVELRASTPREPAFGPCLDWQADGWRSVADASPAVRARIDRAQGHHGRRCLFQHVTRGGHVPLDEPIRTITTKDHWCLVDGSRWRPLTARELARGMGFPESYTWPDLDRVHVVRGLGNAVPPPVARDLVRATMEAA